MLWQPNFFAPVKLPALKLTPSEPWVIAEVSFVIDQDRGTMADLTLMPKEAFTTEPIILVPFFWDPTATPPPGGGAANSTGDRGPGLG